MDVETRTAISVLDGPRKRDAGQMGEYVCGRIECERYHKGAKATEADGAGEWIDGSMDRWMMDGDKSCLSD